MEVGRLVCSRFGIDTGCIFVFFRFNATPLCLWLSSFFRSRWLFFNDCIATHLNYRWKLVFEWGLFDLYSVLSGTWNLQEINDYINSKHYR